MMTCFICGKRAWCFIDAQVSKASYEACDDPMHILTLIREALDDSPIQMINVSRI